MIGYFAYAEGSPCPTLVLDRAPLPEEEGELLGVLTAVRQWLISRGVGSVLKIALIGRSPHPAFDLDYRFVQALPGDGSGFDLGGSCGHSILASVVAATRLGWLRPLAPGDRVRVQVLNNGDNMVCEVDEADRYRNRFTVHLFHQPSNRLGDLLLTGEPVSSVEAVGGRVPVSLVSMGNPYVFIDAADLRVGSRRELFANDPVLFSRMSEVRAAAASLLRWPVTGTFPKVAVVGQFTPGRLAVRAISVPSWHPTLALTGATCLGAASAIEGTIPFRLATRAGCTPGSVEIDTPGGRTNVSTAISGNSPESALHWVSISGKTVRFLGSLAVEPLHRFVGKESAECLSLLA
ncbi:hypothetical protein N5079_25525 [Planotetraspora sp. A-T 1434]|uniref:PrpF domain-containing protein n=1 Tax=Planotetraspora sp. A-T 1434 TaxID=2979219 RepID=UPI0021BF0060|nr:PrpF domain-containing protein [Planotetraspora sp. A-T 1434]MCT9933579.1 hypothetical protein [Planotetraspora sp. A-T 1434]